MSLPPGTYTFQLSTDRTRYDQTGNISVPFTSVPEPATLALAAWSSLALLRRRREMNRSVAAGFAVAGAGPRKRSAAPGA